MKKYFIFVFMFFIAVSAYAAENIEVMEAADNIYVLVSPKGGNVTVSTGEDGTFLIDDQLAGRSEIIQTAAKEINNQDIKFILNTHYHFDHSGGNEYFGGNDAIIIAHDNVRKRLSTKQFITYFKKEMEPMSEVGLPTITITNDMMFHYNNDDVRFIHIPEAHTDGDAIAYFTKANVIVAGDLIFNGFYPFIDIEHGGSIKGLIAGVDILLNIADSNTVVIPGHGSIMSKSDLQKYREMLLIISDKIETSISENKTLEQVVEGKPTQEYDEQLGAGIVPPDAFVTIIFNSLSRL